MAWPEWAWPMQEQKCGMPNSLNTFSLSVHCTRLLDCGALLLLLPCIHRHGPQPCGPAHSGLMDCSQPDSVQDPTATWTRNSGHTGFVSSSTETQLYFFCDWPEGNRILETQGYNSTKIKLSTISSSPVGPPEMLIPWHPKKPTSTNISQVILLFFKYHRVHLYQPRR